jgi:hypothetical protein
MLVWVVLSYATCATVTIPEDGVEIFTKHCLAGEVAVVLATSRSGFAINGGHWKVTAKDDRVMKRANGLYLFAGHGGSATIESLREQDLTIVSGSSGGRFPRSLDGVLEENIDIFLRTDPSTVFDMSRLDRGTAYTISQPFGVPLHDAVGDILAVRSAKRVANVSHFRMTSDYLSCNDCDYECYIWEEDYSLCGDPWDNYFCDDNCYSYCYDYDCHCMGNCYYGGGGYGRYGTWAGAAVGGVIVIIVIIVVICYCTPCCRKGTVAQGAVVAGDGGVPVVVVQQPAGYPPQAAYGQPVPVQTF